MNRCTIPLSLLPRRLAELTGKSVTYRQCYARVLDGALPAEKVGGRWHIRPEDEAAAAKAMGLDLPAATVSAD